MAQGVSKPLQGGDLTMSKPKYIRVHCDSCEMLAINGVACHEQGCPRARKVKCFDCGGSYNPVDEDGFTQDCPDCVSAQYVDSVD